MRSSKAAQVALGGVFASLAIVIMCLGGLISVATFVCPVLCLILCSLIRDLCGNRIAWAWYGAVAILALLLAPDKEAAGVFLALGYYPIIRPCFCKGTVGLLLKLVYFNVIVITLYTILLHVLGLDQLVQDFEGVDFIGTAVLLLLGNLTFLLLDFSLSRFEKRKAHGR